MAADILGKQQVRTDSPDDVQVQVADGATPSQKLSVDSNGKIPAKVSAADGTAIGATGDALKVDVAAQSLAALKISRDGSAPAANKANFVEIATGAGPAVVSSGNPLAVSFSAVTGGTVLRGSVDTAYDKAAAVAGNGGSADHDYTVSGGVTLTVYEITVSAPGAARFDVILDAGGTPVTIDTFYIPATGGNFTKVYDKNPPTVATGDIFRIHKVNNEKAVGQALDLVSSWMGSEA